MPRHFITASLALSLFAGLAACGGGQSSSTNTSAASSTVQNPTAPQGDLKLFATETEAQQVCPQDEIVWLNPATGIYHEKTSHFYGHTKRGNYVCRKAADAAGDRDSKAG
jgi:hypothetical protein